VKYQTDQRAVDVHTATVVLDETRCLVSASLVDPANAGTDFRRRSLQSKAYPASFLMLLRRWSDICAGE
jgi:hypothetical protein